MEPQPPAGSPPRRGTPPPLLCPSSGSAFPAATDGDHRAAVSEHPCVTLVQWWLATVERDGDQKIAVAGMFERNQTLQEYSPAAIAKRHTQFVLETEDGTILLINPSSFHNVSQSFSNGYSTMVCGEFLNGFPQRWQSCKLCSPELTNSFNTSNSVVDSTKFYLEKFEQGKHLISKCDEILESFSHNNAVFQKSSHFLLNETPRFEEYTCDGDIATYENAATSSEPTTGDQKSPVVSLEVRGCRKETQHKSLTVKAAVDEGMPASVCLDMQNSFCLSNGTPILEEDAAASNDGNERYTAISKEVTNMEVVLVTGSPSRERAHDDIATDVSLAPTVECTNNAVSEAVDSTPATGTYCKKTPVASLKSQGSWRKKQHIASNKKPVGQPKKQISPHEKRQSATRSQGTRTAISHPVGQPKKQISPHEKLQIATRSQGTRSAISHPKKKIFPHEKHQSVTRSQGTRSAISHPVGQPKKQISPHGKCQSATGSQETRSAISRVLWSPLTRGKATPLSIYTPEALNLNRSRSGRVIVPKLDEGCQSIVYGWDGSIAAVIGVDSPAMFKYGQSKTDRRKKRRTE